MFVWTAVAPLRRGCDSAVCDNRLLRGCEKIPQNRKSGNVWITERPAATPFYMMSEQAVLIKLEQRPDESPHSSAASSAAPVGVLKLRRPNRRQFTYAAIDVEALIPADHAARAIWELSGRFDLDGFAAPLRSLEGEAGRPAWEPRLLVSVWIWAYSEGIGSAREIERQCAYHPALQWLCGLETISHKTLSDFPGGARGSAGRFVHAAAGAVEPSRLGGSGTGDGRRHAHPPRRVRRVRCGGRERSSGT